MNTLTLLYLATGYIVAFNTCQRLESAGKPLGLIDTGIVILFSMFLWLPGRVLNIYLDALCIIIDKFKSRNEQSDKT